MIVREAYRNRTHRVCQRHYADHESLPYAAGPVESALRPHGDCEECERERQGDAPWVTSPRDEDGE